ncbi:MAG TPA: SGNH/GDSL hydrolase family protein [Ramlibacter sp.]|uniref:SGNH/GDSL hydrolase family protein n=1 Tax=Ramlibacter sp. TaxID=1917967 RepID=UPI002D7EF761|nr:SGNH/GDSL hydrolase family protein [Ramlibacter sp.]HET8746101.1 SGNH/GDSL hydrolase family protein [Ramlibacter sp.]
MQQGRRPLLAVLVAAVALLAGCGGGDDIGPKTDIARVVVAGDSLADSGTFGARFTVQNSADPANPFPVFSEIVQRNFDAPALCPFFVATSATNVVENPTPGCTNFAVGGGRIHLHDSDATPDLPQTSIPAQLQRAGEVIGTYAPTDLVLVDGGGNDAADLVTAFLGAGTGAAGLQNYQNFLLQELDPATLQATLPQTNGAALAAGLYMQALADTYYDAIKVNVLDRGATHVAVLNMPDVTLIPGLQPAFAAVSNANGGGAAGAAAVATFQATVRQWLQAFNTQLAARVGSDGRVAIVPFFADINEEIGNPESFALTNVTGMACVDALGVNSGAACTSAALDAAPPAGLAPGWWRTWAFADPLHPTPFGHQLLAASVNRALARAGWL